MREKIEFRKIEKLTIKNPVKHIQTVPDDVSEAKRWKMRHWISPRGTK